MQQEVLWRSCAKSPMTHHFAKKSRRQHDDVATTRAVRHHKSTIDCAFLAHNIIIVVPFHEGST